MIWGYVVSHFKNHCHKETDPLFWWGYFLLLVVEIWNLGYICKTAYHRKSILLIFCISQRNWACCRCIFSFSFWQTSSKKLSTCSLDPALQYSRDFIRFRYRIILMKVSILELGVFHRLLTQICQQIHRFVNKFTDLLTNSAHRLLFKNIPVHVYLHLLKGDVVYGCKTALLRRARYLCHSNSFYIDPLPQATDCVDWIFLLMRDKKCF